MTPIELVSIGGFITVVAGALVTVLRLRPDRDALIITQAQGAGKMYNDLVKTLHSEIERLRVEVAALRVEVDRLRVENEGLRERFGTRRDDPADGG